MQRKKPTASKANGKSAAASTSKSNTLTVTTKEGKSRERNIAELSASPTAANAITARTFAKGSFGEIDLTESIYVMREAADKVKAGDLGDVEARLTAQAVTLDAMFNELARRAALNMGTHLNATESYLRLALKAQSQCRATLETLAEVKYPRAATFVRQQNVAYQQQVNNGGAAGDSRTSTHTGARTHGRTPNQSNELLGAQHGERLDSGTPGAAGGEDPHVETVGAVNRAAHRSGQEAQ